MGASFPRLLGSGPIPARVSGTGTVSILAIPLDRLMSAGVPLLKAPYFTAPNLLVVGAYATHLQENTRYANAKGADAVWLQDTIDPILLETLGHRHGVLFPEKTSQEKRRPRRTSAPDVRRQRRTPAPKSSQSLRRMAAATRLTSLQSIAVLNTRPVRAWTCRCPCTRPTSSPASRS